jgi:hypothetical protein
MPIESHWDDDQKIIYRYTITGRWTLAEFFAQLPVFKAALADVPHPVYTIVDVRKARMAAGIMGDAAQIVFGERIPNDTLKIVLGGETLYRHVYEGIETFLKMIYITLEPPVVWVGSEAEAYQVIAEHRARRNPPE